MLQIIAEGANGPVTLGADKILLDRKILVIPVSNYAATALSYFVGVAIGGGGGSHNNLCMGYGHVARLPPEDPAHPILSCRDPRGCTMPRARPHAS